MLNLIISIWFWEAWNLLLKISVSVWSLETILGENRYHVHICCLQPCTLAQYHSCNFDMFTLIWYIYDHTLDVLSLMLWNDGL